VPRDHRSDEVGDLARALASMQEALQRQESARRAFVATASHELRTPLTSLGWSLELLDEDLAEDVPDLREARAQVAGAHAQLRRLQRLAAELLDLSRLDADVELRREPVELGELARAVAAEFEQPARDQGVRLEVVPPRGPCWAGGDPGAIARIVRILLDNALRVAPGSSAITVEPAYAGEAAVIAVQDEGPGVPEEERERIFERFERGSRTGGEGGFGLGLAIGRELAERQGGSLTLEPERPGDRGARFTLRLPIDLPGGHAAEPAGAPPPASVAD
jgi:signal transduction histidine kinase